MRRECEHQQCTTRGEEGGHSFISKLCLTTPREGNKVAAFCLLASCLRCCRCFFGSLLRFFMFLHFTFGFYARYKHAHPHTHTSTHRGTQGSGTQTGIKNHCILFWAVANYAPNTFAVAIFMCRSALCVCECVCAWVFEWMSLCMYVCVCVLAWVCPPLAARQKHKLDFFLSLRVAIHVDVCVCVCLYK